MGIVEEAILQVIDIDAYNHEIEQEELDSRFLEARRTLIMNYAASLPPEDGLHICGYLQMCSPGESELASATRAAPVGRRTSMAWEMLKLVRDDRSITNLIDYAVMLELAFRYGPRGASG